MLLLEEFFYLFFGSVKIDAIYYVFRKWNFFDDVEIDGNVWEFPYRPYRIQLDFNLTWSATSSNFEINSWLGIIVTYLLKFWLDLIFFTLKFVFSFKKWLDLSQGFLEIPAFMSLLIFGCNDFYLQTVSLLLNRFNLTSVIFTQRVFRSFLSPQL